MLKLEILVKVMCTEFKSTGNKKGIAKLAKQGCSVGKAGGGQIRARIERTFMHILNYWVLTQEEWPKSVRRATSLGVSAR